MTQAFEQSSEQEVTQKEGFCPESLCCKEQSSVEDKFVSITEAAKLNKVTRQAIYIAIKLNKLKAKKESTRWKINLKDLAEYRENKYSRAKSTFNGELLFDSAKGYYSVNQVAQMLKVPAQKIYYATRAGYLKAQRRGAAWVIHGDDIEAYKRDHFNKRRRKSKVS